MSSLARFGEQNLRLRIRRPTTIILALFSIIILANIGYTLYPYSQVPSHHRYNAIFEKTPTWTHPLWQKIMYSPAGLIEAPPIIEGLRNAPWAGSWELPRLSVPKSSKNTTTTPALAMIHIFSMPNKKSRQRRNLIRKLNLLEAIPDEYKHLVEIKFVLGYDQSIKEYEEGYKTILEEEEEIQSESDRYRDLIRLRELEDGENMNKGKSWEWLRYVGREGGRRGWWVLKCDDDTLPLLPNLLPFLTSLDPSIPTYLGSALGRWPGHHYYFEGMMYGFSWGVVKTMAVADVPREIRNEDWDEDGRIGEAMFSLPLSPNIIPNSTYCSSFPDYDPILSIPPANPDPCTGLVRIDLASRIGMWREWLIDDEKTAVAWHGLKRDHDYISAYAQARDGFTNRNGNYKWEVPPVFEPLSG
ncbi:uncharacterized protein L201_000729 [Kwoniella dendrophila CBS 6074]|uniref:Hexosyltransferase n=1 Tax=Kwoniella dendrophila CBS 6074 TaxID=1295534 RepID=A0AAX4JKC8_9TREE